MVIFSYSRVILGSIGLVGLHLHLSPKTCVSIKLNILVWPEPTKKPGWMGKFCERGRAAFQGVLEAVEE